MSPPPEPPVIRRQSRGPPVTMNREELERARKIVTYDARAVANQSKAVAAEVTARDWVTSAYKGRAKLRAVMVRPGGVPVLDYLFETGNGDFVVVEAKSANAQLGSTKGRILMVQPGGGVYVLELPGDVEQFSPTWFEQRLEEMRGPKGDPASRRLAAELDRSWRAGKVRALVIRAPEGARTTEVAMEVLDHSDEWNTHVRATPAHAIPAGSEVGAVVSGAPVKKGVSQQRPPAERIVAIHKADEKRLMKERDRLDAQRKKVEADLGRAKGRLKTAEKKKLEAQDRPRTRQATKDKLDAKVTTEKAEVARLEKEAAEARQAVDNVKQELSGLRQRLKDSRAELHKLRSAAVPPGTSAPVGATAATQQDLSATSRAIDPPASATEADAAALKASRATDARAVTSRATESAADATRAKGIAEGEESLGALAQGAEGAKAGRLVRILSLSKTIGKIAVGFFIPLSKLEILLELALWLYDWDRRRRQADEREWRRIYWFLFESAELFADPFSISYQPAIGDWIWNEMNRRLDNERDQQNFTFWVGEWDKNPGWSGFVYVGVAGDFLRQEHTPGISSAAKAPYPIRYWARGAVRLKFKRWSTESSRWKKEGPTTELREDDSDNLFTLGKAGDPFSKEENQGPTPSAAAGELRNDYLYRRVKSTPLSIRVTSPTPILTPFDYLVFKCKDLMIEVLRFISRFDEYFLVTRPFTRDNAFTIAWYDNVKFPEPIDSGKAHWCLKKLFALIQLLEMHTPLHSESAEKGWERRRQMIVSLVPPNRTQNDLSDMAKKLRLLASDLNYVAYRPVQDADLSYLTNEYLAALASDIEQSARRIYRDMMSGKDSARSYEYRYMGSLDR